MRACILILTVLVAAGRCADGATAERPNILVILADDLGYGDLSAYGAEDLRTPNIDKLAAGGVRFDFFRANSCVCSPTRAALLSGRYPDSVGVPGVIRTHPEDSWGYLASSAVLLPQILRGAGYKTALIGKWHLGLEAPNLPNDRGFDFFHGFLGDMMDDYLTHRRHGQNYMRRNREVIEPEGHATELFAEWACEYVRERRSGEPFFLYLAFNAPHVPIQPPPERVERVRARQPGIDPGRARLVALIEQMDDAVGRVLKTLDEAGLAGKTVVIFTSDNGGELGPKARNGQTRAGKGTMYEGGLRVPCVVRWPGRIAEGRRSDAAAVTMDLFPTVLDAAQARASKRVDGQSLLPILLNEAGRLPERTLFFTRREGGPFGGKTIDAMISGSWKLVQNSPFGALELYDLAADPLETRDVIASEKGVANRMMREWRRQMQRGGVVPWQGQAE